jgi:hypothetical protein
VVAVAGFIELDFFFSGPQPVQNLFSLLLAKANLVVYFEILLKTAVQPQMVILQYVMQTDGIAI